MTLKTADPREATGDPRTERGRPRDRNPAPSKASRLLLVTLVVSAGMLVGALLTWVPDEPSRWAWAPLGIAYLVGGIPILRSTIESLSEKRLSIDFLMGAAALGAAGVGQPLEGAILIFLFSLSNTLEAYALGHTRRAIGALMDLHPEEATLLDDKGRELGRVAVDRLEVGQRILVRPGERVAADGSVTRGSSEVDQAAITGESAPVAKAPGDDVFAGTINGGGVLTVEVTRPSDQTMLARIVKMVEEAREEQAPAQEFIDRFAHPYILLVLAGSAVTFLGAWLLFGFSWTDAVYRSMTLLVVASPCALVISTPAAVLSAIAHGARRGVLLKGGGILDLAGTVETVAFDKTGTLTLGRPRLLATQVTPGVESADLLLRVAAVEAASEHHLARAVLEAAAASDIGVPSVEDFRATPGEGVMATLDGERCWVGNVRMASRRECEPDPVLRRWMDEQTGEGRSVVLAGAGNRILGALAFGDELRPGAAGMIKRLRSEGIRHIVLLSGDHPGAVGAIAREVGADEFRAQLLPDQKVAVIRQLAANSRGVAMIGDGVNDAPAMAAATVGVAMGAAGTDVAIETADVVLMSDELDKVDYLFRLGRRSRRIVRQNVWFSVGWMGLLVLVASTVGMPLTLAVVAHEGSTLLVVLNGLRLLGGRG
jgi:Zn2+/Cd2+-exporting ATPase